MILFKPSDISIDIPPGISLVEAAARAGISIGIPCGGQGTCGKCRVLLRKGELVYNDGTSVHTVSSAMPDAKAPTEILACQAVLTATDIEIEIPESHGFSNEIFDEEDQISGSLENIDYSPFSEIAGISIPEPFAGSCISDIDRMRNALHEIYPDREIDIPRSILQDLPLVLREHGGNVSVSIGIEAASVHVSALTPGHNHPRNLGIAVDVGTTTISIALVDLEKGSVRKVSGTYNDQRSCGLDVISRINYSRDRSHIDDLRHRVLVSINRVLESFYNDGLAVRDEILSAHISGNTVMMHLLLGIVPEYIRLEPYTPAVLDIPSFSAHECGININRRGRIHFSPCVGSYVGGDITAGLLCTGLIHDPESVSVFLDIGTNGELVVGNSEFLITCACSAGPAFEGGGVEWGMHASDGAVNLISVDQATGCPTYRVIGGGRAAGICGSAMIDLIAGLFQTGWLDPSGKFYRTRASARIAEKGKSAHYIIVPHDESSHGEAITVSETDIGNILRAKAAIYAASTLIMEKVGISFHDIKNFYVAGGFGKYVDMRNAVILGLLPDMPAEKFVYVGNSSLIGSAMALVSRACGKLLHETSRRMTYLDLSNEPEYMDHFTAAFFIPHTNLNLFPSVRRGV